VIKGLLKRSTSEDVVISLHQWKARGARQGSLLSASFAPLLLFVPAKYTPSRTTYASGPRCLVFSFFFFWLAETGGIREKGTHKALRRPGLAGGVYYRRERSDDNATREVRQWAAAIPDVVVDSTGFDAARVRSVSLQTLMEFLAEENIG